MGWLLTETRNAAGATNSCRGWALHEYNRFARGEEVFSDPEEAIECLELFRDLKQRDGLQVLAWSLLSNHYYLALRTSTGVGGGEGNEAQIGCQIGG